MVLAESAIIAAKIAIEENDSIIQDIDYENLKMELISSGQVIEWVQPN